MKGFSTGFRLEGSGKPGQLYRQIVLKSRGRLSKSEPPLEPQKPKALNPEP